MVNYDPNIIIGFAQKLYMRAQSIVALYGVLFALLGFAGGGAMGEALDAPLGVAGLMMAVLLGALGALVGNAKASELRLRAQVALCQVQIEFNSRPR